jgi:hypothetical protein
VSYDSILPECDTASYDSILPESDTVSYDSVLLECDTVSYDSVLPECDTVSYDSILPECDTVPKDFSVLGCDACYSDSGSQHFEEIYCSHLRGAKQYSRNIFYVALILTNLIFVNYRIRCLYLHEFKENPVNYILILHFRSSRGGFCNTNIILLQFILKISYIGKSDTQ